ncbi:cadherin-related family member 5 [Periophthalmus magnuspinnatus]|uniref:cadherin-related family member 5 n=1 Tax=Periophthalmus magnuspinnatus TaxID=409849 RepID=UPI00243687B3|nr:cadherin-related family member 5 [Periophthalmus magnuspinnatus]
MFLQLAAVNTVVFTVKAMDADGDMLRYTIDPATLDSSYFRIDQSNSGNVVLDKPLDYETKTNLKMLIWAMETNTAERFSTSTEVIVSVQDGDDQYPHFLPCVPLSLELPVCTNPSYSTNVTEKQKNLVLKFSPGPVKAEDGDRGLDTPLKYSILSGNDWDRFVINSSTGQITLTKAAEDRRQTPFFRLNIMASQLDDPIKYSIASVLVRVVAENMYPPVFNQSTYKGFVVQSSSPAAIVSTYGNQVLLIQVSDLDFPDGRNPNVQYSLYSPSVTEGLYHITQGGVLIAKTDRLYAFDRHIIQVIARDEESGEEVSASVDIEVLQRGQATPRGTLTEEQFVRDIETGVISAAILLLLLTAALFLLLRMLRRKHNRQKLEREAKDERQHIEVLN